MSHDRVGKKAQAHPPFRASGLGLRTELAEGLTIKTQVPSHTSTLR